MTLGIGGFQLNQHYRWCLAGLRVGPRPWDCAAGQGGDRRPMPHNL